MVNEPSPTEATDSQLADFIGMTKAIAAQALQDEKKWTDEAKRRRKKKFEGELFDVTVVRSTRLCLSRNSVVQKLGEAWVKAHSAVSKRAEVRAHAKAKAAA